MASLVVLCFPPSGRLLIKQHINIFPGTFFLSICAIFPMNFSWRLVMLSWMELMFLNLFLTSSFLMRVLFLCSGFVVCCCDQNVLTFVCFSLFVTNFHTPVTVSLGKYFYLIRFLSRG